MQSNKKNLNSQSRGKRGTVEQKRYIVTFMEENINFAHERFEGDTGAITQHQKWEELANALNGMGGAKKSAEQWKQYWRDLKRNVKAKASEEKRKLNESGVNGLIGVKSNLDDVERRVITIITPDVIDGDGESQERGFNRPTISYSDVLNPTSPDYTVEYLEDEDTIQPPKNLPKRARRSRPSFRATETKLDNYINFEREKLNFEKEKFKFHEEIERKKLLLKEREVQALENIAKALIETNSV